MQLKQLYKLISNDTPAEKHITYQKLAEMGAEMIYMIFFNGFLFQIYDNGCIVAYDPVQKRTLAFYVSQMIWEGQPVFPRKKPQKEDALIEAFRSLPAFDALAAYVMARFQQNSDSTYAIHCDFHIEPEERNESVRNDFSPEEIIMQAFDLQEQKHHRRLLLERLLLALLQLTPKQHEAVTLLYIRGLSVDEAAKELGISRTALINRRDGALKKLRKLMQTQSHLGKKEGEKGRDSFPN